MHQASNVQFERALEEFVEWRAVAEQARSPAPAWWWGTAIELRDVAKPMPKERIMAPSHSGEAKNCSNHLRLAPCGGKECARGIERQAAKREVGCLNQFAQSIVQT